MIPRVLPAVGVFLAVLAATAAAQQPDYKAAAEHYKTAEAAMASGDFATAALEYGVAFDITKDPILFFKIGQANERAGKCPVALTYYNRYLREGNPSEDYRKLTEERVAVCSQPGGAPPVEPPPVEPPPVDPVDPGVGALDPGDGDDSGLGLGGGDGGPSFIDGGTSWKRKGAWIATGVTVALTAAGVVLAMSAEGTEEDLQALIDFRNGGRPVRFDEVRDQYASLQADGERFDKLATIALASAGATAVIATTLFLLDRGSGGESSVARLRPTVDRHGGGLAYGWEF